MGVKYPATYLPIKKYIRLILDTVRTSDAIARGVVTHTNVALSYGSVVARYYVDAYSRAYRISRRVQG